jgi:signal transduction histidine kinase
MSNAIRFTEMSTEIREIKVALDVALGPPVGESCAPPRVHTQISRESVQEDTPIYIYMSIQDSGPGLQKEDLALLFQR